MIRFVSLKWKISLTLIFVTSIVMSAYIMMATDTFQTDKISYLFDFYQLKAEAESKQISDRISRSIFSSKSILASFQSATGELSGLGRKYFDQVEDIKALRIFADPIQQTVFQIQKEGFKFPEIPKESSFSSDPQITTFQGSHSQILVIRYKVLDDSDKSAEALNIEIYVEAARFLSESSVEGLMGMVYKSDLLESKGESAFTQAILNSILKIVEKKTSSQSSIVKIGSVEYLLSISKSAYPEISTFYIEPKSIAFKSLQLLATKSILFAVFSFCLLGITALLTSSRLTQNMRKLTDAAENIGRGKLDTETGIRSNDEVGLLAKTFELMAKEIKKLLVQEKDRERMAQELKTTQFVQSHLFPSVFKMISANIQVEGRHLTSTECGGDWWYYFTAGEHVYAVIADATGHGTPAALITAVSRAIFVTYEKNPQGLNVMASEWSQAVAKCSGQRIYMTAIIFKIHSKTGEYEILNASHETPLLVAADDEGPRSLPMPMGKTLGEVVNSAEYEWEVYNGQLKPGERVIFYTDGIWDIKTANGTKYSDIRMLKTLQKLSMQSKTQDSFLDNLFDFIKKNQGEEAYKDDIAFVILDFKETEG